MKVSSVFRSCFLALSSAVVLSGYTAHAATFDVTDLFQIQVVGSYLGTLSNTVANLIATITMTEFGYCFGSYTAVAPGQNITFTRRQRQLRELLEQVLEHELVNATSTSTTAAAAVVVVQAPAPQTSTTMEEIATTETERERHLATVRTCPSDCTNQERKCAYNGCATKGNRRRRRQLRSAAQKEELARFLATFNFDLDACEAAITLKLKVFTLLGLECIIEVNP